MVNMAILWAVIYCINRRSRKSHGKPYAAAQVRTTTHVLHLLVGVLAASKMSTYSSAALVMWQGDNRASRNSDFCRLILVERVQRQPPICCLQEELLLSSAVALAVTSLLLGLQKGCGQDYTFACFFLISATLLLQVRWFLGSAILAIPVIVVFIAPLWGSILPQVLPQEAELHLTVAWALGALIAFLADAQRRYEQLI